MTTKQSVGYHSIVALFSPLEAEQPAARRAANVAAKLQSQVTLAHIAPASESEYESAAADDKVLDQLLEQHPEIVLAKSAKGSLLEIIRLAAEVSGDLIVLDRLGLSQLQPLLQESSDGKCDHGECDALVVRARGGGEDPKMADYRHIVVAADLNDQGLMTIYKAVRMAKRYSARLTLLNVLDQFDADQEQAVAAKALRSRGLDAFTAVIEGLEVEKEVLVTAETVHQAVSAYAKHQQADLLVIGSHKYQGLCVLLGNTARQVIKETDCDVLVVHE
ncbi:universal stress protein [Sedimenticola sp.]|uniref:universal stress protein n=1 Tax=Sedimenticola sp. TaxID=1940285 RepID=UPI003D10008A